MKAVLAEQCGVENLEVAEAADPTAGQGEVLVATEAATVNPADGAVARGAAGATNSVQPRCDSFSCATTPCESGVLEGQGC